MLDIAIFDSVNREPVYPFGFGLGYTTFTIEPKTFAADEKEVSVTVTVKNTGTAAGKEVVQVYYSAPAAKLDKPYQELAGFAKTKELAAGEQQDVTVTFSTAEMASFCEESSAYVMEAGDYVIRVGNSSRSTQVCGVVSLDQDAVTEKTKHLCPGWGFEDLVCSHISCAGEADQAAAAPKVQIAAEKMAVVEHSYSEVMPELPQKDAFDFSLVRSGERTLDDFVAGLTDEQLAYLCIGHYKDVKGMDPMSAIGAASYQVAGAAGETTGRMKDLGVPGLVMADGPAGLRISPAYKVVGDEMKGGRRRRI